MDMSMMERLEPKKVNHYIPPQTPLPNHKMIMIVLILVII
jgi:hypothetical protein